VESSPEKARDRKSGHFLTYTVWLVSLISLFTDIAGEMLYPIMPLYLQSIGFSVFWIGILEGVAEATASYSKGYFGKLSDAWGRRVPFVRVGYIMSIAAKPLIVATAHPLWVFFCRTLDRFGKGVRTGARDAMLSDATDAANKGKVFGFHRALDTLGAAIGAALALVYLAFYPTDYKNLFLLAIAPGVIAVALTYLLKETTQTKTEGKAKVGWADFLRYWRLAPSEYRSTVIGLLLFALFNSSDVFLLLALKSHGLGDREVIAIYIFYNIVYALFSFPAGRLGDRIGLKPTFLIGIALFAVTYATVGFADNLTVLIAAFFAYGLYAALTEGVSKAWITNLCRKEDTATAVGTFAALQSAATMVASFLAGLIWQQVSVQAVFLMAAAGATLSLLYFLSRTRQRVA